MTRMFQNRGESLFICKSCGEALRIKKLESHVKEAHFWNDEFNFSRK